MSEDAREQQSEPPARDEELLRALEEARRPKEEQPAELELEIEPESEDGLGLAAPATETPITAGEAPPPAQWRGEQKDGRQASSAELIQVPVDARQAEEAAQAEPSIADAEPASFSEAPEPSLAAHKAAERPRRRARRVVRVKRKRRRPASRGKGPSVGLPRLIGRGGDEPPRRPATKGREEAMAAGPADREGKHGAGAAGPGEPESRASAGRARRLTRKRARAREAAQATPGPEAEAPQAAEPKVDDAQARPGESGPKAAAPAPPEAQPAGEGAAELPEREDPQAQADGAPEQPREEGAADQAEEQRPSLLARIASLFRRREGADDEAARAGAPSAPEEPPADDSGPAEERRPSLGERLAGALKRRPEGKRQAQSEAAFEAREEGAQAGAPAAPQVVEGADEERKPPEAERAPAETPRRRGRRRIIGGGVSEEERRAELERRRLERRRRAERERERREERRRLVRRVREGVAGFVRGQINEESEAWARRRRWLEERKRRREERKAERERRREERRRRREEKPNVFRKAKQRIDARRAARARRLQRNIAGLEISASRLRAVHLREGREIDVYEVALPEGVIVGGLLEEPEVLAEYIKRLWREAKLRTKKVNFSIPANRKVTMRTVSLAAENPDDIAQALAMMVPRVIAPMDPEESIVDYAELSRSGPQTDLQVAAADEEMVKAYAQAVSKAGLLPVSCEIGALAASRAIIVPRSPRHAQLVIDIGAETTTVAAASGPDVFYLRVVELGGNDFTEAIHAKLGLPYPEARRLKERVGLAGPVPEGVDPELARAARAAMRPVADRLSQEISNIRRDYEQAVFEGERVGRQVTGYLVLGGGAKLRGLVEQIELFARLPMRHELRPYRGLETAPDLEMTATCLGLARGHTMSLLPEVPAASFKLSNPLRRKSKISMSAAERQAKRLAQERRRRRQPGTDPRLIGALVGALAIAGAYFIDQRRSPDESALVEPIVAEEGVPSMRIKYPNDPAAEGMAEALLATPQGSSLGGLPGIFAANKARIVSVTVDGARVIVNATSRQGAAAERVERAVRKRVPEAESVTMQKGQGQGRAFTIIVEIPHEAKVNQ